jgi:glyoxylase-like metal-dependent hydrolase (beta-lactamase superfamily II)
MAFDTSGRTAGSRPDPSGLPGSASVTLLRRRGLLRRAVAMAAAAQVPIAAALQAGCAASMSSPASAGASSASGAAAAAPAAGAGSTAERLDDGVFVFRGVPGDIGPDTLARHGNGGFVVGAKGVLVIDAGVSHAQGRERLAAVRAATRAPVLGVLLTHAMQDFIFGATAFQDDGIRVLMHKDAAQLTTARCETCLKTLKRELGDAAMAGTRVPKADRVFATAAEARAALPDIGRALRLVFAEPKSQTASLGATALFDEASGTLFAGALLDARTVPDIQDADLAAWQAARVGLRGFNARRIVPGRGPVGGAAIIDEVDAYLGALEASVDAFVKAGHPLSDVADAIELPRFAGWDRYDTTHRRNASILYLRRERELILRSG